jgi:hypothetical protein
LHLIDYLEINQLPSVFPDIGVKVSVAKYSQQQKKLNGGHDYYGKLVIIKQEQIYHRQVNQQNDITNP